MENENRMKQREFVNKPTNTCQMCKKRVVSRVALSHINLHVLESKKKFRYVCNHCEFVDVSITSVKKHTLSVHNDKNGFVDRVEEYFDDFNEMSMACFNTHLTPSLAGKKRVADFDPAENPIKKNTTSATSENSDNLSRTLPNDKENDLIVEPIVSDGFVQKKAKTDKQLKEVSFSKEYEAIAATEFDRTMKPEMMDATRVKIQKDDDSLFENHRLQKKWNTSELAENVRIVAEKMEFQKQNIDRVVYIFTKNMIDGSTLCYEDDHLTEFFSHYHVVYGIKRATLEILKKMKFKEFKDEIRTQCGF